MNTSADRQLLSQEEPELLTYEKIVEEKFKEGWRNFFKAGQALGKILEAKLYLARCDTFKEYCEQRWQCSDKRAYQLIGAAAVVANIEEAKMRMSTIVDIPTHEGQVRSLVALPPSQQWKAWILATKGSPNPTAREVTDAVRQINGVAVEIPFDGKSSETGLPPPIPQTGMKRIKSSSPGSARSAGRMSPRL